MDNRDISRRLEIEPVIRRKQSPSVHWFPLWSNSELSPWPENESNPLRTERQWAPNELVYLYSGNMGLGHRFGEFLEAARRLGPAGPRWAFAGGGMRKTEVEAVASANPQIRIEILGYVPHNQLRAHLCSADVHLVSLDSAWQGFMVPSKLQGSFAVGKPVIYVGGRKSETALWILESGGGWVVDENDIDSMLKVIEQTFDASERRRRGEAAFKYAQENFQIPLTCNLMAQLLENGRV